MLLHVDASAVEFCPVGILSAGCVVFPSENGVVWISLHVGVRPSSFATGRADASTYVSSWPVSAGVWVHGCLVAGGVLRSSEPLRLEVPSVRQRFVSCICLFAGLADWI